jgi:hypothetical protein
MWLGIAEMEILFRGLGGNEEFSFYIVYVLKWLLLCEMDIKVNPY